MAIVLALLSSVLWGIADFAGGTASRRLPALVVVLASQAAGLACVAVVAAVLGSWRDPIGYLPWAVAAGAVGAIGLVCFYHALSLGTMGVISPIAALGVVVPVGVGLATGHWPTAVVAVGLVLAIVGVVAASGPDRSAGRSVTPIALAAVAAVGFGAALLLISRGAAFSPLMTMVTMRATSVLALAVVFAVGRAYRPRHVRTAGSARPDDNEARRVRRRPGRRLVGVVIMVGLFDVSANLAFGLASTAGALTIVAVLGSLYPAVTVLLARILHQERLARIQQVGVAAALAGVVLIAGWS